MEAKERSKESHQTKPKRKPRKWIQFKNKSHQPQKNKRLKQNLKIIMIKNLCIYKLSKMKKAHRIKIVKISKNS